MTRHRLRIIAPRWTCPAWVAGDAPFHVIVVGEIHEAPEVWLRGRDGDTPMRLVSVERLPPRRGRSFTRLTCQAEAHDMPASRLWALEVRTGPYRAQAPNSIASLPSCPSDFSFAHISDLHLLAAKGGQLTDRRPLATQLVEQINALAPAFVLNTGDLISRYGIDTVRLDDRLIWWQAREARRIFLGLEAPMFVIPGNHDRAFRASRSAWTRYMGRPWGRSSDDYAFIFGDARFLGLDGSQLCDEQSHEKLDGMRTQAQLSWLREALRAALDRPRVVFTHWDYAGDIAPILAEEGCDLCLCGHTEAPPEGVFPYAVGHLPGSCALRVWHVQGGQIAPGAELLFDALGAAPALSGQNRERAGLPR